MVADLQVFHQVEHRLIRVSAVEHGRILHVLPGPVRKPVGACRASSNYPFAGGIVVDVAVSAVEIVDGGVGEVAKVLESAGALSGQQQYSPTLIEPDHVREVQGEDAAEAAAQKNPLKQDSSQRHRGAYRETPNRIVLDHTDGGEMILYK